MSDFLQGKTVLFLSHKMYEYPQKIVEQLEKLGASVSYFPDRAYNGALRNVLKKIIPYFETRSKLHFENKLLNKIKSSGIDYNYFFVIGGNRLSEAFYQNLIKGYPEAKTIMYQWDSQEIHPYFHLMHLFNKVFSFDPEDCKANLKLRYLPLFYTEDYRQLRIRSKTINKKYDLLHIGILHPDRYQKIQHVKQWAQDNRLSYYLYLYIPFSTYVKSFIQGKRYKNVSFNKLSQTQITSLLEESDAVVDFPQNKQVGLTMRTFEVIGSFKKLITTNRTIQQEEVFNPNYVRVINPADIGRELLPFIQANSLPAFLEKENIIEKYTLRSWLLILFND